MTKVFQSITKWLRRKRLLRNLRSKDFDKVVGAVHTILEDSKFYEGVRPNNLPPHVVVTGGVVDGAVILIHGRLDRSESIHRSRNSRLSGTPGLSISFLQLS